MTAAATLSADGLTVTQSKASWSASFPAADLPRWLTLYRSLNERPQARGAYTDDIKALEAVQRAVRDAEWGKA